jgi:citronellyl-CoA dehydrogenase
MMFTEEHHQMTRTVVRFIESEINPHVDEWEAAGMFPAHEVFARMGELDLLGINKPPEFGGLGLDYSFQLAFAEAVGEINCGSIPMSVGVQVDMATPALSRFGSDELRAEFLAPSIAGEYVACIGVSEPGAGSDVANIKTRAHTDGGDYVINGDKMWITNGVQADWMCMLANTGDGDLHTSKSLICVPMDSPGITIERKLDKLGMRSSDTAQIHFDDVRVPQRYRIGDEGLGFGYQMVQFQEERLWAIGSLLRWMEKTIDETVAYTRERQVFGQPLIDNQIIHFTLAELQTKVELLRSMVYRAAQSMLNGEDVTVLASMAKLTGGRLARELADSCLQYYGGMGFMNETPVSRFFRDTRLVSIGGGADEVMLGIIAKHMGILPRRQQRGSTLPR